MMIKKILFYSVAASMLSASAVNVANESALVTALSGTDKNITITSSFTTTKNITIPEGYVVTIPNGVTITIGSYKGGFLNLKTYYYDITGSGALVTRNYKVVTDSTRTLPTIGGANNKFSGMTYDVTKIVVSGGSISRSVSCKQKTSVTVGDGEANQLDFDPKAIVCTASSGINGGRTFLAAYSSFLDAYNAAKFTSYPFNNPPTVTNGKVVVLLADGSMEISEKLKTIGVVVDCAGFSCSISKTLFSSGEYASNSFITFLNGSSASITKLTNSGVAFINCSKATSSEVNTGDQQQAQAHVYDCGTVSLPSTYPSNGGAYFYCGGPYSTSFKTGYKVYGGSYKNDPTSYLASTDLEAVKGSDGNWVVQEKKPVVNVAKVGESAYETLQAAIDAAASGAKIELISDVELSAPATIVAGKSVTLELAGFDIAAANGAIVNNGSLKLEDSSDYDEPSTLSTTSGNLIENNGTLEVTCGTYSGDVLLNAGEFIVHGGKFDGTLKAGVNVSAATSVANLRGGQFKNSVTAFLANEYIETLADGYYWVGKFPYPIVTEKSISNAEKGWSITGLSDEDRAIYVKTSTSRSDYTDAQWYRRAELNSMLTPFIGYAVDCVVKFNRPVKAGSVRVYAQTQATLNDELDRDMAANEIYRALSTKIAESGYTQMSFSRFLKGEEFPSLAVGIENLSDENDGTVCTIELQLCRTKNNIVTETAYVIASESYQLPWKDAVPELREDDTAETVASALEGTADAKVAENIKDVASYSSYWKWTTGVKGATAAEIKAAPNAWLSYALNTTNLVATPADGDLKVESIAPSQDGKFALELSVKDIDIGAGNVDDATVQENLAKVFGIEGATSLEDSAFSTGNVVYTFGTPVGGKVKIEAKSAIETDGRFFMRAKMNP